MQESSQLKTKTISGLLWSFSDLIASQGLQFIIQVILARLLLPTDFGIIGMITVFIAVSNSFIDSGFSQALIREKEANKEDYSTVFYFNLVMAMILYGILFLSASIISSFFSQPRLILIIRVISIVLIINSLGLIQKTILIKSINFKTQTKINMISSIVSGIIAIILAYMGYGVWSLVYRTIIMQLIQSFLLWLSSSWRPKLVFRVNSFKKLFGFGSKLLVSGIIDTVYNNSYYVIIGKAFSASQLGYYTNAVKLSDMASQSITMSLQRVSYPVLSSMQDQNEMLKVGFRKIIKTSVFLNFPIMIGLAVVAEPLINLLFGYRWLNSVPYFQLLCIAGMIYPLHAINLNVLQVKGRSDLFLRLEIIKKFIFTILIIIVLLLKLGVLGLISALIIHSYLAYFINIYYTVELISYTIKEQIKDIIPAYIASIFMAIIIYASNLILPNKIFIKLTLQTIIGVYSYIMICKIAHIKELNIVYELIKSIISRLRRKT